MIANNREESQDFQFSNSLCQSFCNWPMIMIEYLNHSIVKYWGNPMKKSRKILCAALTTLLAVSSAFALEVSRAELESTRGSNIVFQNYSGPHTIINTVDQIRRIGSDLAPSIAADPDNFTTAGNPSRYYVIHAVDPKSPEKLDADILVIGENATVDHVRNLRRIISAYLESAYNYSRSDADTIATFATVYNAVYRNNLDNFTAKYNKIVTDNLTTGKIGIDTNYQEWPGKTQIVIPLFDVRGGLSTVDTSAISDRQVIKSLQNEEDKGIGARKEMVDIKEREADNASEAAQSAQQKATEENEKLKEEQQKSAQANQDASQAKKDAANAEREADKAQRDADNAQKQADNAQKQADNAQKQADEAQKQADEAKAIADANPNDKQAQDNAAKKQAEADKKQAVADEKQNTADEKKAAADEKQNTADEKKATAQDKQNEAQDKQAKAEEQASKTADQAAKTAEAQSESAKAQEQADKKRTEAQEERAAIAEDQQALIRAEEVAEENVLYGLKSIDDLGAMSAIVKMNSATGSLVKESPVSVIRSRTVYEDGNNFVAIAGTNFGNGAIKLVLIDKENLEIAKESNEVLSETSVLVEYDGSYYAVVKTGATSFVVGKFNNNADLEVKSPVAVKAATPITITTKGVLVTSSDGLPVLLNAKDLTAVTGNSKSDAK